MDRQKEDKMYMHRAIQLARNGEGHVSPNPLVGAVIVHKGRIIGEGWHKNYGSAHAEVNALASVSEIDRPLLKASTLYVTLEPCSHYGKTPPCVKLLIETGIGRVVIGSQDPNPQVNGKGIRMLKEAGIEVETGILEKECENLNKTFMTAHRTGRPFVLLKWARSADGKIARTTKDGHLEPIKISTDITSLWVHRIRASYDAIMVGTNTINTDNPYLNTRSWPGRSPKKITFNLHGHLNPHSRIARDKESLIINEEIPLEKLLRKLYKENHITSLIVEGGKHLLQNFIDSGLADEIRIETSTGIIGDGIDEPNLQDIVVLDVDQSDGNKIECLKLRKDVKKT